MITINLFDANFAHAISEDGFDTCTSTRKPKKVQWARNNFNWSDVTVFTDHFIGTDAVTDVESKYKVAWLIEPKSIHPHIYQNIHKLEDRFDLILTFDGDLLKRGDKYKRCIFGGSWISDDEREMYPKSKNISVITSWKTETEGHNLRHKIVQACPQLDAWGKGLKPFDSKLEPLKDYYFSVVIENVSYDYYVTEKLVDCFSTGTIPVYWGCPNIGDIFNKDGIIQFSNFDEFTKLKLNRDMYNDMLPAIKDNFERSKLYQSADDRVADVIMKWKEEHEKSSCIGI